MRVFLSCDMEGATGVVSFDQVSRHKPEYDFGREMQLKDTWAVVTAAREAGAQRIVVNDSHDTMRNLDGRALPREVALISGSPKTLCMMEGASEADVALFVAYHAMGGTEGAILDHTMSSTTVHEVRLNGRAVGEIGLGAALCGALGVPVALVTGDVAACIEAESLLPGVVTCPVKEGHGRFAARLLAPEVTAERLAQATREALARFRDGAFKPWCPPPPYELEVTFSWTSQCDKASWALPFHRVGGRTLRAEHEDFLELHRAFLAAVTLAGTV